MAFFRRPSPFSFNVLSPALSVSASVAPSSSPARAAVSSVDAATVTSTAAQLSVLPTERFMRVSSAWCLIAEAAGLLPRREFLEHAQEPADVLLRRRGCNGATPACDSLSCAGGGSQASAGLDRTKGLPCR